MVEAGNGTVGFQGEPGAWGEEAAAHLAPGLPAVGLPSFDAVFEAVRAGDVGLGVVPVENVYAGPVDGQAERWWRHRLFIVGDLWLPIHHVLAGLPGSRLEEIRVVRSHPQALRQCAPYLERHGFQAVPSTNTATAAREVRAAGDARTAVLASPAAAARFGLHVLDANVSAAPENRTRFWLLARDPLGSTAMGEHRITGVLTVSDPGTAARALSRLRGEGMRLRRLLPLNARHLLVEAVAPGPLTCAPDLDPLSRYRRAALQP